MAHGLRYYKELTHDDGKVVRLEILEKDYTGASMEIGPVCQALRLDIQGDTEIDAPIVKTRLSMTFVDAPDHADANTKKCGDWQEFYTSDATKWQVVIKTKKEAGLNFVTMWGGYITPDSYNEVLVYRGSVTLVARDNIGHMNDFPFDAEGDANGMISMRDVIGGAWAKIESPMSLRLYYDDWMLTNDVVAYDTMMNVSAFEGKSWGEAVEMVLFAYGATLRYVGYNDVAIRPLRWIPQMGAAQGETMQVLEPTFISGAERELTPAVRRIEETVDYQIDPYNIPQVKETDYTGSTDNFIIEGKSYERSGIAWPILNQDYGNGWRSGEYSSFFNPNAYPFHNDKDGDKRFMFLIANNQFVPLNDSAFSARYAEWSKYINVDRVVFNLSLGARYLLLDGVLRDYSGFYNYTTAKVGVYVKLADGTTYYLKSNGEWGLEESLITTEISGNSITIEANIALVASDSVLFGVRIYQILTTAEGHAANYCAVQSASLSVSNALLENNHVNTNYEQQNNVILSREPKLGPAMNDVAISTIIRNGIFVQKGTMFKPTQRWAWPGTTPQQMAVYNHLQLLCYHAKPNNVLRGTIVNADLADLRVIWMWHGAEHMLVSGSINYLNGYIENAVLREFARYEDMWGMLEPADLPDVEGSSMTNVESGSASKSEGARNTINTEVYLGGGNIVLDDYMSDESENGVMNRVIKAYIDNLWHLDESGNLVTDKQVLIKNNLLVEGDAASGGEGGDNPGGGGGGDLDIATLEAYLSDNRYINANNLDTYGVATKSWVSENYLSLSGGTIDGGNNDVPLELKTSGTTAWLRFSTNDGKTRYIGVDNSNSLKYQYDAISYNVIHSGNIGSYAPIYNANGNVLIGTTEDNGCKLEVVGGRVLMFDSNRQSLNSTCIADSALLHLSSLATDNDGLFLGQMSNSTTWIQSAYYGTSANPSSNHTYNLSLNPLGGNVGIGTSSPAYKLDVNGDTRVVGELHINPSYNCFLNLHANSDRGHIQSIQEGIKFLPLHINPHGGNVLIGTTTDTGARLTISNPSSREVLCINSNASNGPIVYLAASNQLTAGFGYDGVAKVMWFENFSASSGLYLNNVGNVGIGTTSPLYKLDVNGTISVVDGIRIGGTNNGVAGLYRNGYITSDNKPNRLWLYNQAEIAIDATTLQILTSTTISGNLIVSGDVASGSDIRFKDIIKDKTIKIEHIAKAPLFTFKWNNRDDNAIHLGSSAQYWENITPWLVKGEDFKTLDYSTLGVAMGISLAKKAVNHEERIKVLEKEIKRLKEEMRYGG